MKLSIVFIGLAVLVAVLVKSGDAEPSRDELLDELTEQLLVRYLDRRNYERNVQSTDGQGMYDDGPVQSTNKRGRYNNGPVRRWWGGSHSSTGNSQTAHNTGNIGGNMINGGLSAGSISGSSQGRK